MSIGKQRIAWDQAQAYNQTSAYQDAISAREKANIANEKRYSQGMGIFDQLLKMYSPGGQFGKGFEAQIERTKEKDVASGAQSLVSSGLYNTTGTAGLGKAWEEDVGQPARLKLEDLRMGRYGDALTQKAGFIERREDIGPSDELFSQIGQAQGYASAPSSGGSSYGAYKPLPSLSWGSSGPSYSPGKSPVQQNLAKRNAAARIEREKRATWGK